MKSKDTVLAAHEDPSGVLGVSPEATLEEIRAAYLQKVKEHPPERDPVTFERVRDAYQMLRDPRRRAQLVILSGEPHASLTSVLQDGPRERKFVGPERWLEVLKEK